MAFSTRASSTRGASAAMTALQQLSTVTTCIAAVRDYVEKMIKCLGKPVSVEHISTAVMAADAPRVLEALVEKAIDTYTAARGRCTAQGVREALLAVEIVTHAAAGQFPFSRPSRFDFIRMGPDIAAPVLVSSNGSDRYGEQKLYGRQLLHFGAFGEQSWRQHDYVWGRLDGAAHLVRLLAACTDVPTWTNPDTIDQMKEDSTVAAQKAVLAEEQMPAECVAEVTQKLRTLDGLGTLNLLRESANGQEAIRGVVTDVLRTLLPPKEPAGPNRKAVWPWRVVRNCASSPAAPGRSAVLGRWASVVLARPVADGVAPRFSWARLVRTLTFYPRCRIWKTILKPSPPQMASRRTR